MDVAVFQHFVGNSTVSWLCLPLKENWTRIFNAKANWHVQYWYAKIFMNTSSCLSNRYYLESSYSQTILVFESLLFSLSIRTLHCFSPNLLLLLLLLDTTIYLEDAFCMNPNCLISLHLLTLGYSFLQYILCEYTYSIHCIHTRLYIYICSKL